MVGARQELEDTNYCLHLLVELIDYSISPQGSDSFPTMIFLPLSKFVLMVSFVVVPSINVIAMNTNHNAPNLLEVMRSLPYFSLLVILIETARIESCFEDEFNKSGIFAPINNAFLDVPTDLMVNLLVHDEWKLHLLYFLKHHMFEGLNLVGFGDTLVLETLTDDIVTLESSEDNGIVINGFSEFVHENVTASNGFIQAIDNAIIPAWYHNSITDFLLADPNRFSTLTSAYNDAGFIDIVSSSSLKPYTIFAPTNKVFADSDIFNDINPLDIQNLLGYHLVPGIYTGADLMQANELENIMKETLQVNVDSVQRTLRINGHLIIQTNILANNGIIHIIDGHLVPSLEHSSTQEPMMTPTTTRTGGINTDVAEPKCGCSSCQGVWSDQAGSNTCGARIQWLQKIEGYNEIDACTKVAVEEFTIECGRCDPAQCSSIKANNPKVLPRNALRPRRHRIKLGIGGKV